MSTGSFPRGLGWMTGLPGRRQPFLSDPFADVRRAVAKFYSAAFALPKKADHFNIHQRHLVHLEDDAGLRRFDLRSKFGEAFAAKTPDQPDADAMAARDVFDLPHLARALQQPARHRKKTTPAWPRGIGVPACLSANAEISAAACRAQA